MRQLAEYEKEYQQVIAQLQQLEQRKQQLTTRGVELQGICKELKTPEVTPIKKEEEVQK